MHLATSPRVLLVGDEHGCTAMRDLFARTGIDATLECVDVATVDDLDATLARDLPAAFDVLVVSSATLGDAWTDVLQRIRARWGSRELPVIVVDAGSARELAAFNAGANGFVGDVGDVGDAFQTRYFRNLVAAFAATPH